MTMPRYAAKRDITEPEIVSVLRQCGFSVYPMDDPCDLLVGFQGRTWLVECKTERKRGGKNKKTEAQEEFIAAWKGSPVVILHDAQEAMDWAVDIASQRAAA